jgi:hypothetical protein
MAGAGRFDGLEIATATIPDGAGGTRAVRHWRRRRLRQPDAIAILAVHSVTAQDRLDLVTARYLGDPTAFWQVADANAALDPDALVGPEAEGTTLVIPMPEV